jgi:hypothetical protein
MAAAQMPYSEPLKLLFIHLPKTGGESVADALRSYHLQGVKHRTYREFAAYHGREKTDRYFVASFVRNPWDQVLSFYSHLRKPAYMRKEDISPHEWYFADGYHLFPLEPSRSACQVPFAEWVERWYGNAPEKNSGAGLTERLGLFLPKVRKWADIRPRVHEPFKQQVHDEIPYFLPYLEWFKDYQGRNRTQFIGRFENLAADFRKLATQLGIDAQLPHLNKSHRGEYREQYDAKSRELIARYFAEEIKTFEYRF